MEPVQRIVLIGLSGTGKSSVGRLVAERLGWDAIDTDAEIEATFEAAIPEIFRRYGEASFRAEERTVLGRALARQRVVIATGGGAVTNPALWQPDLLGQAETLVVALDAQPATSLRRLVDHQRREGSAVERPLLANADPLSRLAGLKRQRQDTYDAANLTIVTDRVSQETIANEIVWLATLAAGDPAPALTPRAPSGDSAIHIGLHRASGLGPMIRDRWPAARGVWIISDDIVGPLHALPVLVSIADSGFAVSGFNVPAGESSKCLQQASDLYDWLLDGGIERGDVVVALGGGVVGDLAGFVAATALRGVGLVQVPTSLLAMVDSSVGGKTGLDHRAGKNLIGAFYQPPLVVIDPTLLRTLPERQVINGWAEMVKHAVIQPSMPGGERADLMAVLERNHRSLNAPTLTAISYLIRRNIELKAAVVEADEREAGIRAFLNFGHTLGHAIEAAGYQLLHGEAIAIGMRAETAIGVQMEVCSQEQASQIAVALDRAGLPRTTAVNPDAALALLGSDKKRAAGNLRWVLPVSTGGVTIRDDVPMPTVVNSLRSVIDPGSDP
ncbi:MAG: 3-dehydroquinate synthase [Chloroflexota bacterium]|nr:3-dehydroquinate synthase [Chloroflexota bacterium]